MDRGKTRGVLADFASRPVMKSREAEQTLGAGPRKRGDWLKAWLGRKREEKEKGFLFIFRKYFRERNNLEIATQFFKATKNILKIPKILGKFSEIDWNMNNPNKVFEAHEKVFRAS
jgi:hypothetical protein